MISRGRRHDEPPRYIVAEIKNDGVVFGWTRAVYTDIREARAELVEAQHNQVAGQGIFELRLVPALVFAMRPR